MDAVSKMSRAFALVMPDEAALEIRDDVALFRAIRSVFAKATPIDGKMREDIDSAVKQLVSQAVTSNEVIDIFGAAGLNAPDISILSDQFLGQLRNLPQKNVALELLRKLLNDEIKARSRTNVVQSRSFAAMLEKAIVRYQNHSVDAAQVITELIEIAKEVRQSNQRGETLGLSEEEVACCDALAANASAVEVLGDQQLAFIAHELLKSVRESVTIDWTVKQNARAKIRVMVKRILRKYGYPPDLQEAATETVLEQAELLAAGWAT